MNNKEKYGEVFTPLNIVNEVMSNSKSYIEDNLTKIVNIQKRKINILDVGTGDGKFIKTFIACYPELSLHANFYGVEMNPDCESEFHNNLNSEKSYNITFVRENFTEIDNTTSILGDLKFDVVMGNPPFNNQGFVKVPCNNKIKKTKEGKSIWHICIQKSIELLNLNGFLLFVSPCLWLKPDKSNTYEQVVNKCKLHFIKNYDSQESHKLFKYKAQTPVNYFLTQKVIKNHDETNEKQRITIFTLDNNQHDFDLYYNHAIPTHNIKFVVQSQNWMDKLERNLSRILLKSNPVDTKKYNIVSFSTQQI